MFDAVIRATLARGLMFDFSILSSGNSLLGQYLTQDLLDTTRSSSPDFWQGFVAGYGFWKCMYLPYNSCSPGPSVVHRYIKDPIPPVFIVQSFSTCAMYRRRNSCQKFQKNSPKRSTLSSFSKSSGTDYR